MKKIFTVTLTLLLSFNCFSQIKNYVGIVREEIQPERKESLENLSKLLSIKGYWRYSEVVDAYLNGAFGSGFVYVDKNGDNYIITNKHVVSQAQSASIEFENTNGTTSKYENLSVFFVDNDIDLAILRFDSNARPFKNGLQPFTGSLTDGQDVVSAGYPGLGSSPVWQFGKGSVTNANARIKELMDPNISTIIQHSAQIDAGNSGGPLLIPSSRSSLGYLVVGINTWKAVYRDATNFAIPVQLAIKLIEESKKQQDVEAYKLNCKDEFKQAVQNSENDWTSIIKFVSCEYALKNGEGSFDDIMRHGDTKTRNRLSAEFAWNPIGGLRYAAAFKLFGQFSGEKATEEELQRLDWQNENGFYRIMSIKEPEKKKRKSLNKKTVKK